MANTSIDAQRDAWNKAAGSVRDFILGNLDKGIADGHWLDVSLFASKPSSPPLDVARRFLSQAFIQWSPTVGTSVIPAEPMEVVASGTWESPVPLL